MDFSSRDALFSAIRDEALLRSSEQRLIAPDGSASSWMIDLRRLSMDAKLLDAFASLFWEIYADRLPFQIGGMEMAAIPLVSAILMKSITRGTPVNGFLVRKARKLYGTGQLIEGVLSDEPVIVIDDILNSGQSMEKVRVVLEELKITLSDTFVIIDYHSLKGEAWRNRHKIAVKSLFSLSEFDLVLDKPQSEPLPALFRKVWDFTPADPNYFHLVPKSFPATDGKRVYFGSDAGVFWALHAADGSVAWNFKTVSPGHKNIWSSPALHDGKVFFGSYDGNVYCLEAETGKEIWRYTGADWIGSSPALAPDLNLLFIGTEFAIEGKRGGICALDMQTGQKIWDHPTKRYTHASPAYWAERQLVACGSNDNEIFLFEAKTGAVRWRFNTKPIGNLSGSVRHAPAFDKKRGHLISGCANGYVYIIDVETGENVWWVRTENTIYTVPLIVDDRAYIGSTDKYLYVLDLQNYKIKNKIFAASKIFGPPRLIEGQVYFGATNGIIYAVDHATSDVIGTYQLPDAVTNAITYNEESGHFYALTYVNQLFALKRETTPPDLLRGVS